MSEPTPFQEYAVPGFGTVIRHEDGCYIVRMADGRVVGFAAPGGSPVQANAAADIAATIANPPAAPVPVSISRAAFVIAARRVLGLTEGTIYALISQLPEGEQRETARDLYENALEFRRDNSLLVALAQLNGNTEEQVDEIFRTGATLALD